MRVDVRQPIVAVLLACSVLLVLGFALKAQCRDDYNRDRDRLLCSNDIQVLYATRGLAERQPPYVDGRLTDDGQLTGGTVEYPVLTGLAAWLPALVVSDAADYLTATAVLLAPFALLSAAMLARLARWRALIFAAAPPLVWYSFHNWDHLVVAATVAALLAWYRGQPLVAAGLLGLGASLKVWPGFFVAPLVLERLRAGDRKGAAAVGGTAVAAWSAVNLPFVAVNPAGWWAPYAFQGERRADITSGSIWFWGLPEVGLETLNRLIPALLALSFGGALAYGWHRSRAEGRYPFLGVSAAMLAAFMLLNKAHSPQFALWLLPFFCLLRLRWGWWTTYLALDTVFYVGLFRWYYDLSQGVDFGLAKQALVIGVWGRAVMLVLLYVAFLRAQTVLDRSSPASRPRAPTPA
jgi:uncharacterized membrane protein